MKFPLRLLHGIGQDCLRICLKPDYPSPERSDIWLQREGLIIVGTAETYFSFCLCADDYALSPGVSRGILEALGAGRLSATSVMTTRPFWPKGAHELRQFNAKADIGLHLNLTLGSPLGYMPAYAISGRLPELGHVLKAARKWELPEAEVGQEISRQLDSFCEHFGAAPAFVDGHQHVQILPQIRSQLFACLEQKGLSGKIWLRTSSDRPWRILRRGVELPKALGIAWLGSGFAREAAARGFLANDGFAGFSAFDPGHDYAADFARYLRAPGRRHLIMCHPGYCDEELVAADPVTLSRERELSFLLSPAFTEMLDRKRARLVRLSNALSHGTVPA
ncbi:MAG: ChbG/HpnK family deacetylase [Pseudomonadota bacterium]|nr:ChbG/HpnK family deacetylase [Pseudomonadota bacterium]